LIGVDFALDGLKSPLDGVESLWSKSLRWSKSFLEPPHFTLTPRKKVT